jgi:hypothetical protein
MAMSSPFPGMDPWLENHWEGVHTRLVTYAADQLNERLPADLIAAVEERVAVQAEDEESGVYWPDVRIVGPDGHEVPAAAGVLDTPATEVLRLVAQVEAATERYIRIVEAGSERLVTVIEVLSPANKLPPGIAQFRAKRAELLEGGVNFVEIDLVRRGNWRRLLRPHICPPRGVATYRATVRLPGDPGAVLLVPMSLQRPLPAVSIPLRPGEAMLPLELQSLVDRVYAHGRFGQRLNYSAPLDPPLEPADAAWAAARLRERKQASDPSTPG